MRRWLLVALLLLPLPALAQDEPPEPCEDCEPVEEPAEVEAHPRLVAAGWCPVRTGEPSYDAPACDVGLGLALHTWRRLAVVAVVGSDTVGAGLAWVVRDGDGPAVAIAAGVVARYDDRGVDGGELYPALGVTLNFGRGRP
jgi:hypothetical protein